MQIAVCISKRCSNKPRIWHYKDDKRSFCACCGAVKQHHEVRGELIV